MKKFLLTLCILFIGLGVSAEVIEIESNVNMTNFWQKLDKREEKVLGVGTKILNANKIDKHIAFKVDRRYKIVNATASPTHKVVTVYYGLLPYLDNDDELAAIMGHEIAHCIDQYGGPFKWMDMKLNSKEYEFKADLIGIDLMAKAGYNPLAAITAAKKWMGENYWDFWILTTHPKTSRRMIAMYKYIYRKYPEALQSDMIHNVNYENFTYSSQKEINVFQHLEKQRAKNQRRGVL